MFFLAKQKTALKRLKLPRTGVRRREPHTEAIWRRESIVQIVQIKAFQTKKIHKKMRLPLVSHLSIFVKYCIMKSIVVFEATQRLLINSMRC